jgi:RimJ/RimL family protein N-acetyltransferase
VNESKSIRLEVTDEFYLSPIVRTDKAAYLKHFADPEIAQNLLAIPFPYTEADADWWLDHCEQSVGSPVTNFALRAPSGYLIGAIGVVGALSPDAHSAEFGYWLAQPYRGHGLMPRVIRTFSDYAFQQLRIHRLFATPFSSNLASHRALEKAGFQREGYSDITTSSKAYTSMQLSMDAFLTPTETPNQSAAASAMTSSQHVYEVRPRNDKRGFDLISDALPFGRLWYREPDAINYAIGYAKFRSRSHDAPVSSEKVSFVSCKV